MEHPGSDVHFPPVENGLDYLISVTEHLAADEDEVSARDLKYAVLHLQAAAEVLLKYRLQLEHWSLVFTKVDQASREVFERGTFNSCGTDDTIARLSKIVGIEISQQDATAFKDLEKARNSLQHYGLTDSGRAVEARAAAALDALIRFLDVHLLPHLDDAHRPQTENDMERIRGGLTRVRGFVAKRMQRLTAELRDFTECTVQCPDCRQWALLITMGGIQCRFCMREWDPNTAAIGYAVEVLEHDWQYVRDRYANWQDLAADADTWATITRPPTEQCPECGLTTLVRGVLTASDPETPAALCFWCTTRFPDSCLRCHKPCRLGDREPACEDCLEERSGS